jgi:hypothetical protein
MVSICIPNLGKVRQLVEYPRRQKLICSSQPVHPLCGCGRAGAPGWYQLSLFLGSCSAHMALRQLKQNPKPGHGILSTYKAQKLYLTTHRQMQKVKMHNYPGHCQNLKNLF